MCYRKSCSRCSKDEDCGWCAAAGECFGMDASSTCPAASWITDEHKCPKVAADVILRNLLGMVGAMLGIAIIFNVLNRVSNRRRSEKLQQSIFTLPVYVYSASSRRRAAATPQAQAQGPSDSLQSVADLGTTLSSASATMPSSADEGDSSVVACAICLAAYEEEQVIKVLPCKHEFHSDCLVSWLERKPMCPLCKAPAFTCAPSRGLIDRGQARVQDLWASAVVLPYFRPALPDHPPDTQLDGGVGSGSGSGSGLGSGLGVDGGLLSERPASPLALQSTQIGGALSVDVDVSGLPAQAGGVPTFEAGDTGTRSLEDGSVREERQRQVEILVR